MRGDDRQQGAMFSYLSPEQRAPTDYPLRPIRQMVAEVLRELSPRFDGMYAQMGRPSIAPEKLLRALLPQILYSPRSERARGAVRLQFSCSCWWWYFLPAGCPDTRRLPSLVAIAGPAVNKTRVLGLNFPR